MKIVSDVRRIVTGVGIANIAAYLRRHSDNVGLATEETDTDGFWTYEVAGSPGPLYAEFLVQGLTRYRSTRSAPPAGPFVVGEANYVLRILGNGVVAGDGDGLAVTATGGLSVEVASGLAVGYGVIYRSTDATTLNLKTNNDGSSRTDRIVVECHPAGTATEGYAALAIVKGVAGDGVPALTQTDTVYQIPIARVVVGKNVSSVASGDISDDRTWFLTGITQRNPAVVGIGRRTSTTIVTDNTNTPVTVNIILANGVQYDVRATGGVLCRRDTANDASSYINAISPHASTGADSTHNLTDWTWLRSGHTWTQTGNGNTQGVDLVVYRAGASGSVDSSVATLTVVATPRA